MNSATALLIVDMVKDFTHEDGLVYYPQNRQILPVITQVLNACRKHKVLVIFLQQRYRANKYDKNLVTMRPCCIEGSGGEEIDEALSVDFQRDYVIPKRRYSGFFGTDLDLVLREHHIEHVVIVGTKTNCCIRATATDAYYLNYDVVVLSDCVGTNDEVVNHVNLDDIAKYIGTVTTSEAFIKGLEEERY